MNYEELTKDYSKDYFDIATVYTLKEFEDKFNKHEMDNNNISIEFFVE